MALKLTCPGCQSPVEAEEADRGKSIRCGICWGDVKVPGTGSGVVSTAAAAVKPTAPAAVAPASAIVPAKAAPVAKAVVASPVAVKPASEAPTPAVAKASPLPAKAAVATKPTSKVDVDLSDEEPEPLPKKKSKGEEQKPKSGSTLKIILGVLAGLMVLGLLFIGVVGYVIYSSFKAASDEIANDFQNLPTQPELLKDPPIPVAAGGGGMGRPNGINNFNPQPNLNIPPQQNPIPNAPSPSITTWELKWETFNQANNFSVSMPPNVRTSSRTALVNSEVVRGEQFTCTEGHTTYQIEYYDLPDELMMAPQEFTEKHLGKGATKPVKNTGLVIKSLGSSSAVETMFESQTRSILARTSKLGCRMFIFSVSRTPRLDNSFSGYDFSKVSDKFFNSVKFNYNVAAKAPPSSNPKVAPPKNPRPELPTPMNPNIAKLPGVGRPFDPMFPPPFPGGPIPGIPDGNMLDPNAKTPKLVTKIDTHLTAIYLSDRKQVLTLAPTGESTMLRLVSTESYKTMMSLSLPLPFQHVAVDEKTKRLYLAGGPTNGPVDSMAGTMIKGELHCYDLDKLLGMTGAKEKPILAKSYNGKIMGLQLTSNGKSLFVGLNNQIVRNAKTKSHVEKLSTSALAKEAEADTAQLIYGMRLSPDGKTLMVYEHPFNSFGFPVFGSGLTAPVEIFNNNLSKPMVATTQGLVSDLQFVSDEKAFAVVMVGNSTKIFTINPKGETQDVTPVTGAPRAMQAGFLSVALANGGLNYQLVVSSRVGSGLDIYSTPVDGQTAVKQVGSAGVVTGSLLAGSVLPIPNSKTIIIGMGAVLDLTGIE